MKLNIVITGGSKGLGSALVYNFKKDGHNVYSISRTQTCDVSNRFQLMYTMNQIPKPIDIWINNAGQSGGYRPFQQHSHESIESVIQTNLQGTALSCSMAYEIMSKQPHGGAIFNLSGAGSNGQPTPNYALYGASKAGVVQLSKSLQKEWKDTNVRLHVISPGMMFTDLLLENLPNTLQNKIAFICSTPQEVANDLAPKIIHAYIKKSSSYITYMTISNVFQKLFTQRAET